MIKAPKYMPADILRKLTKEQLYILQTQKNTKGKTSENAQRAQKILWQLSGHTSKHTGISSPLNFYEKYGLDIPTEEAIDLSEWLNGSEILEVNDGNK